MRQYLIDYELEWLDPDFVPTSVTIDTNHGLGMTNDEYDEAQAKSYGYDSVEDMNKHNADHDKQTYLTCGDKTKGLI